LSDFLVGSRRRTPAFALTRLTWRYLVLYLRDVAGVLSQSSLNGCSEATDIQLRVSKPLARSSIGRRFLERGVRRLEPGVGGHEQRPGLPRVADAFLLRWGLKARSTVPRINSTSVTHIGSPRRTERSGTATTITSGQGLCRRFPRPAGAFGSLEVPLSVTSSSFNNSDLLSRHSAQLAHRPVHLRVGCRYCVLQGFRLVQRPAVAGLENPAVTVARAAGC